MNQVLVKSKDGVTITFYVKNGQEMCEWTEDINTQSKLYTENKRKHAGNLIRSSNVYPLLMLIISQNPCPWSKHAKLMM